MKSLISSILLFSLVLTGCKKSGDESEEEYKCTTCVSQPEAKAAYDVSSRGIYKGIVIGSSGTVKFDVMNGNPDSIFVTLVIDGSSAILKSNDNWTNGQIYVGTFSGNFNGQPASVTFQVNPDGSNPIVISSNIPGHPNAYFTLVKELSNNLIEAFEGTFQSSKPDAGTFNILISRELKLWGGTARSNNPGSEIENVGGTIKNGNELFDEDEQTVVGTVYGDKISGSFSTGSSNVTISGKRTL